MAASVAINDRPAAARRRHFAGAGCGAVMTAKLGYLDLFA